MPMAAVAVLGSGYWGKNLVRVFHQLGALQCVCDPRANVLSEVKSEYGVRTESDFGKVITDPAIQAVAIAVPAAQHYVIAKEALLCRKDVFVEKPLALTSQQGRELVELARKQQRILMVGHILQYHPAILELKRLIKAGELGKIQYLYSSRLNLGKLRTEENILWSFAPHDISAILFLLEEVPTRISAHAGTFVNPQIADISLTTCDFRSGVKAHIFVSWLHPFKEQKLAIVGERRMAVFNDIEKEKKLVLYAHRIDWLDRMPVAHKDDGEVVPLTNDEPLKKECEHFLDCVSTRHIPRTNGDSGVQVLRILEACEESARRGGIPIDVQTQTPDYYAHPTAVIDEPCEIGNGTKIWHFSHIMSGAKVGKGCNLGQNVVISPGVTIGNNVKIQNNVSVYTGVELQDDVFCGPSMVFTNVINPRSHIVRRHEYRKTLVRKGATLGANSTIVCGAIVGRYAFVAAGAVVVRDVPDYALVAGVPAKQIGSVCYCGVRLEGCGRVVCRECAREYELSQNECREIEPVQNATIGVVSG